MNDVRLDRWHEFPSVCVFFVRVDVADRDGPVVVARRSDGGRRLCVARLVGVLAEEDRVAMDLLRCWLDVSNAGGAVGFPFPPVSDEEMRGAMQRLVSDVNSGAVALFVAERDDELVGWVALRLNRSDLTRHWAIVERLQARPEHRNDGVGRTLMAAVVEHAKTSGLEQLRLVLRGGEGLEDFYGELGWIEIGRQPAALRLATGDDRDEVMMVFAVQPGSSGSSD